MAKRLEKDALAGAFARGPKPELEFLVPEKPKRARAKKKKDTDPPDSPPAPDPTPPAAPVPTPIAPTTASVTLDPDPEVRLAAPTGPHARPYWADTGPHPRPATLASTAVFTRTLEPEPPRWSPAAPPLPRGLRWRLERRWDALLRGLLRSTLGWV